MRSIILLAAALAGCTTGAPIPGQIAGVKPDLMIEPRRIKPLKEGGDLKRYTLILAARNGDLVDQVKGLQAYVAEVSGQKITKAKD